MSSNLKQNKKLANYVNIKVWKVKNFPLLCISRDNESLPVRVNTLEVWDPFLDLSQLKIVEDKFIKDKGIRKKIIKYLDSNFDIIYESSLPPFNYEGIGEDERKVILNIILEHL